MQTSANFEDRQSFALRLTVLRVAAIVGFVAIAVAFWIFQVVEHQRYEQLAERQHLRKRFRRSRCTCRHRFAQC